MRQLVEDLAGNEESPHDSAGRDDAAVDTLGLDLASEVVIPELLGSDRFELEGHVFEVCGGHPDLA
ncbi:hypothetical protein ABT224_33095 [Streptomyces sp. NPDC001584]|uniref:hypothetical protein n=1 Tax=Streptomyces sp. NPDC001584 TaxID=3154521 RepID=UPI00332AD2CA